MRCSAITLSTLVQGTYIAMLAVLMIACSLLELFSFIVANFKHGLRAASYELRPANCDAAQRSAAHCNRNRNRATAAFLNSAGICSTYGTVRGYTHSTLEASHDGVPCLECGLVAFRAPSREEPTKS